MRTGLRARAAIAAGVALLAAGCGGRSIVVGPTMALDQTALSFTAVAGDADPAQQIVTVSATGQGSLARPLVSISYQGGSGWLGASVGRSAAPFLIGVRPTLAGLVPGAYAATLSIASEGAGNGPLSIAVSLVVTGTGPPALLVTPGSLAFTAAPGQADPAAKSLAVADGGGGVLAAPTASVTYGGSSGGWLETAVTGAAAPYAISVQPRIAGLPAGFYSAAISIASAGAVNTPQTVVVTLSLGAAQPPALSLSANALSFQGQAGASGPAAKTLQVDNGGGGTLASPTAQVQYASGSGWLSFSVSGAAAPYSVAVQPQTAGLGAGSYAALLALSSAGASNNPQTVQVTLTLAASGAALCASPSPVQFGQATVGQKVDRTLTLTSCGTAAVTLQAASFSAASSSSFTAVSGLPGAQTLAPGASIAVGLRWLPTQAGADSALLHLPNGADASQSVALVGTALASTACRLAASAAQVDFGQVLRGQGKQQDVTVVNRGNQACTVSAVSLGAGTTVFQLGAAPPPAAVLQPGDTLSVAVTYAPPASDANASDTGQVTFQSDDPVTPSLLVALVGKPVATPQCSLQITPASGTGGTLASRLLQFGNVAVGRDKLLPITLRNAGTAACSVGTPAMTQLLPGSTCAATDCGDFHLVAPAPAASLQPGESTAVSVRFAPTSTASTGNALSTIYVQLQTGDPGPSECNFPLPTGTAGCVEVALAGQGDLSSLEVLPEDLELGATTLGCKSPAQTVTVYNTGGSVVSLQSFALAPANGPFTLVAPPAPVSLAAGAVSKLQVTYWPSQAARETAQLLIASDAATSTGNPYVAVTLGGSGTATVHQRDAFTQPLLPKVDLLFVVDDSGSFQQYQTLLAGSASALLCAARKDPSNCSSGDWKVDFHLGVIGNEADQTDTADSYSAYPGDEIYVGGLFGHPAIIDSATPSPVDAFAKNVKIGTCCSDQRESDAEAAWRALSPKQLQTAPPQGTQGFLRDDARLVIVAVTDEVDQSRGTSDFYADFFRQVKGRAAGLVSFNAVTGDRSVGCSANGLQAAANDFDADLVQKTSGVFFSLCTSDWNQIARQLAADAFGGRRQFPLSRAADPASLQVTVNGAAQVAGTDYAFDAASQTLTFQTAPPPGAAIAIDYDAACH